MEAEGQESHAIKGICNGREPWRLSIATPDYRTTPVAA